MHNRAICTFFMTLKGCEMSKHGTQAVVKFSIWMHSKISAGERLCATMLWSKSFLRSVESELMAELEQKHTSLDSQPTEFRLAE